MSNVVAVVAAHGKLAAGLVSAVQAITGRGEELIPVSNEGLSAADVNAAMNAAFESAKRIWS